jgi:chaperonin cofactor prefoldin
MTNVVRATLILILLYLFATIFEDRAFAQNRDYTRDFQALEYRISRIEKGMKEVSDLSVNGVENTLGFYQEAGTILKETKSRIDSLERRTTEMEDLKSRIATLEKEMLEIEKKQVVGKERGVDTGLLAKKDLGGKQIIRMKRTSNDNYDDSSRRQTGTQTDLISRQLRQGKTVRIFTFEAYTLKGVKTEIRYYTVRHISPEEIEWPDYFVGDLKHLKLVASKVLLPFTD